MNNKLLRDKDHKVIGGVCSGLANYFDIDPTLVRLLFAIAFFVFSSGFWIYLILWVVMPAGSTVRETSIQSDTDDVSETADHLVEKTPATSEVSKGGLVLGLILIGCGAVGLIHRYVPEINWNTIWPILLIVLGIFLILPYKNK